MSEEEIVELNDKIWEKKVEKSIKPVVVMFYTDTCPFCKQMEPYFNEYSREFKDRVVFYKINLRNSQTIAARYGVMGTPTFKFFCKGKPIHELVGAIYPSLLKKGVEEQLENGENCVNKVTWYPPTIDGYA